MCLPSNAIYIVSANLFVMAIVILRWESIDGASAFVYLGSAFVISPLAFILLPLAIVL